LVAAGFSLRDRKRNYCNKEMTKFPITKEEKAELDRRLDAYHQYPNEGMPWSIVRERLRNRGKYSPFTFGKPGNSYSK